MNAQEAEDMARYLTMTCSALVRRLGGRVTLSPEEIAAAAALDARWERDGRDYTITVEDDTCQR